MIVIASGVSDLTPGTWMEGDIEIYPRYKYDEDRGVEVEFDPHLVGIIRT